MVRAFLGLLLVAGFYLMLSDPQIASAQKGGNAGKIVKIDAKTGAITINTLVTVSKKKKELTDSEFFLNDDAKVTINDGGEKKTMTGKEAIKEGAIKEGMQCTFAANGVKITELTIGGPAKGK